MPTTQTFTGDAIKTQTSMLAMFCDKEKLAECVANADRYVYEASSFKDFGPDYTRHSFFKGEKLLGEFRIGGY